MEEVTQPGYSLASIDIESTFSSTALHAVTAFFKSIDPSEA